MMILRATCDMVTMACPRCRRRRKKAGGRRKKEGGRKKQGR
jgi:hypothetical protein